jgi:hypothetical protein
MHTAIHNNLKEHFVTRLLRFINLTTTESQRKRKRIRTYYLYPNICLCSRIFCSKYSEHFFGVSMCSVAFVEKRLRGIATLYLPNLSFFLNIYPAYLPSSNIMYTHTAIILRIFLDSPVIVTAFITIVFLIQVDLSHFFRIRKPIQGGNQSASSKAERCAL